jgi:hypothetical protein
MKERIAVDFKKIFLQRPHFSFVSLFCLMTLSLALLTACDGSPFSASAPTPTPTTIPPVDNNKPTLLGAAPSEICDQAMQQIQQNQIGLIVLYKQKEGNRYVPTNSITGIELFLRASRLADGTYPPLSAIDIYPLMNPDWTCHPQVLKATQQINAHLSKDQKIVLSWIYSME